MVLTILGFAGITGASWVSLNREAAQSEARISAACDRLTAMEADQIRSRAERLEIAKQLAGIQATVNEIRNAVNRLDAKITALQGIDDDTRRLADALR